MTNDEWNECDDAFEMLQALKRGLSPTAFKSLYPALRGYLLACCENISGLLPQQIFKIGRDAAKRCLEGDLDRKVLHWLDWYVAAECHKIEFEPECKDVRDLVVSVEEVKDLPYDQAIARLQGAARFAEAAIVGLFPGSQFKAYWTHLCPTLLRKFIPTPFEPDSLAKATPFPLMTNREWAECNDIFRMVRNLRRLPSEKKRSLKLRETVCRFLNASCEKHDHLLQTPMIRIGLQEAKAHFDSPLSYGKRRALWSNAFDEVEELKHEVDAKVPKLQSQAWQLALAAIMGSWARSLSDASALMSVDLLREYLPAPFDH